MSDTPRTDRKEKETARLGLYKHAYYGWKWARQLERELNEAKELLSVIHDNRQDGIR